MAMAESPNKVAHWKGAQRRRDYASKRAERWTWITYNGRWGLEARDTTAVVAKNNIQDFGTSNMEWNRLLAAPFPIVIQPIGFLMAFSVIYTIIG